MDSYKPIVETSRKHDKASKKWSGSACDLLHTRRVNCRRAYRRRQQKKITDALEKIAGAKEPEFSKRQGDYEPIQSGRTIELADEDKVSVHTCILFRTAKMAGNGLKPNVGLLAYADCRRYLSLGLRL